VLLRLSLTIAGVVLTLVLSTALALARSTNPPPQQPAQSNPGHPFQDPRGRYSLSMPPGWEVSMAGDDPTFHNGASWIQVRIVTARSPSAAVDQIADLFRPQFTAFNTINRGNTTIAGRVSHGLNVDGVTTAGQRVSVLLTAQPAGGAKQYFVLVSSTPVAQAPQLNTSVMALANSVRFSGE
jgi:hypothetical protein